MKEQIRKDLGKIQSRKPSPTVSSSLLQPSRSRRLPFGCEIFLAFLGIMPWLVDRLSYRRFVGILVGPPLALFTNKMLLDADMLCATVELWILR